MEFWKRTGLCGTTMGVQTHRVFVRERSSNTGDGKFHPPTQANRWLQHPSDEDLSPGTPFEWATLPPRLRNNLLTFCSHPPGP